MEYQCSVSCHCGKPSINVHCYGTFEYCKGVCSRCGAVHIGKQIPLSNGDHRYISEISHTVKSSMLHFFELIRR